MTSLVLLFRGPVCLEYCGALARQFLEATNTRAYDLGRQVFRARLTRAAGAGQQCLRPRPRPPAEIQDFCRPPLKSVTPAHATQSAKEIPPDFDVFPDHRPDGMCWPRPTKILPGYSAAKNHPFPAGAANFLHHVRCARPQRFRAGIFRSSNANRPFGECA